MKNKLTALLFIAFFIVVSNFAFSATIYVKHDASGSNNGSSWANAYTLFQSALNSANSGDQIWVAAGTYKPTSAYDLTNTPRFYHFRMKNGVTIYGGFAGTETSVSQRTDFGDGDANETILSGDLSGNDNFNVANGGYQGTTGNDNCYHVFYHPSGLGLTSTSILDGFTVTGGNANGSSPHNYGGGVYNNNNSPKFINCVFTINAASYRGGALATFQSNSTLINTLIFNNWVENSGGGICVENSSNITLTNTTLTKNFAWNGGGVWIQNSDLILNNSILRGNLEGGGAGDQIGMFLSNVTLNYTCYSDGAANIFNNTSTFTATNNNTTSDPQFFDFAGNDFRLFSASPAVNSGNNTYNTEATDIRGKQRIQNTTIDMGAYEWTSGVDPQSPCNNPTSGGTIAAAQTICNNTAPAAFTNSALPSGHTGTLEYKWQKSTTSAAAGFIDIASSNSATYTSGALTATTWFKRLARVSCSADWSGAAESNVIQVAILPTTVYVSSSYSSSTEGWGVSHFADVDDVLDLACTGITVNISDYTHTGNFNISGHTLILGNGDFVHNGTLSGGLIRTTGTGRLMQTAVQNTPRTFPVTDGTNNFTVTITPTSESTSGMIGVKLNTGKVVEGTLVSPMTFFDIYGDEDLDATVFLRIDKAAISPATMEANTIMRFWNGERYQPIPTDRVTISDQVDCYIITITGMNYFNNVIPD